MNVALISWTKETQSCIKRLCTSVHVKAVVEKNFRCWNLGEEDIEICSIDKAIDTYKKHEIDRFIIPCLVKGNVLSSMYLLLKKFDVDDEDILYIPYRLISQEIDFSIYDLPMFIDRTDLDRLELHINDHCNLKCANCSMFAGLVEGEVNADLEITKKSLGKLKRIYEHINEIDLFGGEPLLNPQLQEYCEFVRELYPKTIIYIVTNGTGILNMDTSLVSCIKENDIHFSITYYPDFDEHIESVMHFCLKNSIKFMMLRRRVKFLKLYDFNSEYSSDEMFRCCKRKLSIIAMRENKLASCYVPFAFPYADKIFEFGYKEDGLIDLLNDNLTPREVIMKFMQPMDCCRFCHWDRTAWMQVKENEIKNIENWSC